MTGGTGDIVHESVSLIILAFRAVNWAEEAGIFGVVEIGSSSANCLLVAEVLSGVEPSGGSAGRTNDAGSRDATFTTIIRAAGTGVV